MAGRRHYKKDGSVFTGKTHRMPNGSVHSGSKHSSASTRLYSYNDLSKTAQKRARSNWR